MAPWRHVPGPAMTTTRRLSPYDLVPLAALGLGLGAFILCTLGGVVTGIARLPPEALDPPPDDLALRTPEAWSWGGLIYRNPEDDRLWVPKRDGGGWTCNLAHPRGRSLIWGGLALPLALFILLIAQKVLA